MHRNIGGCLIRGGDIHAPVHVSSGLPIIFLNFKFDALITSRLTEAEKDQRPIDMQCLISTSSLVAWWMHMYS
ncbi:hypothetical protein SETIT_3G380900v2 [Setaria italica]|uniref:Uncharacterized protein n=1 Tax=Setaria italica TaxID=4555 RepID=A0A368QNT3_SETIT|nr:hypothetical protein SETIT_3G380900v2 [Setaria italica]